MTNSLDNSHDEKDSDNNASFSRNALLLANQISSRSIDYQCATNALTGLAIRARTLSEYKVCSAISGIIKKKLDRKFRDPHADFANSLGSRSPVDIYFINDNGGYAGAGIATVRQAKAFALNNHNATLIALNFDSSDVSRSINALNHESRHDKKYDNFNALQSPLMHKEDAFGRHEYSEYLATMVPAGSPVIIGNLHSSRISLKFIFTLIRMKCAVFMYSHDLDFVTGGCAYPQYYSCSNYKNKCTDHECPKPPDHYPCSSSGVISVQGIERELIAENPYVKLFANSNWTESFLREKYSKARISRSYLGLDTTTFRPSLANRLQLRKELGIRSDSFVLAVGADSLSRKGKGGEIVSWLVEEFGGYSDIRFLSFGHSDIKSANIHSMGYCDGELPIAKVFQSADLYVNPAIIEAFGQTAIESAACGCPVLGLKGTGLDEAIYHCQNGYLCDDKYHLKKLILALFRDRFTLGALQAEAVKHSLNTFSLNHLYWNWIKACISTPFL